MTSSFDVFGPAEYNPVNYETPGAPFQAPDIASQITREYQQGEARNQAYYNQFTINEQVAAENRAREKNKLDQIQAHQNAEMQKLFKFSDKLVEMAQGQIQKFQKANQARGAVLQLNNGLTQEQATEYQLKMQQAAQLEGEAQTAAIADLKTWGDYTRSENIRSMGSSERIGYANQLMATRKGDFKNDLRQQMSSNQDIKLIDSAGQTFTPATARTVEQVNIASQAVFADLMQDYGIAGADPGFLEDSFLGGKDGARATLQDYVAGRKKEIVINQSQNNKQVADITALANVRSGKVADLNSLWRTHASQLTDEGKVPSYNDAWKSTQATLEGWVKTGMMDQTAVKQQFENNYDPLDPNKTWAEARPKMYADLLAKAADYQTEKLTDQEKAGTAVWKQEEEKINQMMLDRMTKGESFTEEDYKNAQRQLAQIPGGNGLSSKLEKNYKMFSQQTENYESNKKVVIQGIADGTITMEQLKSMGGRLFTEYRGDVTNIERANAATDNFTKQETAIRGEVRAIAADLGKDEDLSTTAELLVYDLLKQVKAQTQQLILSDEKYANDPRGAANAAMATVMAEARKNGLDRAKPFGIYAPGVKGAFPGYLQQELGKVTASSAAAAETIKKFDKDWTEYGASQIDNKEGQPYISTAKLEQNGVGYDSSTWRPHPLVDRMVDLDPSLGTPLDVTNRLRAARDLDELPPPPSLEQTQGASPEVTESLRALQRARTGNQVSRAGSQAGEFIPTLVPNGMGDVVVKAATTGGQRPALVAAIAGVETNFRDIGPTHQDFNGQDYGAFQINQYHVDQGAYVYKPGDIQGNADYAMQVYNEMLQQAKLRGVAPQYQEDFALAAYNGGLQTAGGEEYIPVVNGVPKFRAPAQDYLRKIKKQLARFGDRSVFSSNLAMRGKFATRQVTHPDTGQGYTIVGANDAQGRPVVLAEPALQALAKMVQDSNGQVKWSDIVSAQRSQTKNNSLPGASPSSNHLTGNAVDIHGSSKAWIKANGAKYGWINLVYDGHDGHFDFNQ